MVALVGFGFWHGAEAVMDFLVDFPERGIFQVLMSQGGAGHYSVVLR